MINYKKVKITIILTAIFLTSSCSLLTDEMKNYNKSMGQYYKSKGINLRTWTTVTPYQFNHTKQKILNVKIEGNTTRGNGSVFLPFQWKPGMTVAVDWDVDPNPDEKIPWKKEGCCLNEEAYKAHVSHYQHHQVTAVVPVYKREDLCMIIAHFLPDDRVGLKVSCSGYDMRNYDI